MATVAFSAFPAEIHVSIAKYCNNSDLFNLCLTSKLVYERCLHVLYRDVDLQYHRDGLGVVVSIHQKKSQILYAQVKRQVQFMQTLLNHPEYGKDVRFLKKNLLGPVYENLELALQSLTRVQCVDLAFENFASFPANHFPVCLFQSLTAVRLVGRIPYGLAKSILNAVNPATLKRLCLDLIPDLGIGSPPPRFVPQDKGGNGRIKAFAVVQGLLMPLTGRFTALQTLILRRIDWTVQREMVWHGPAEEASYIEWASFIRSVQGTVEKFMFEQVARFQSHAQHSRGLPLEFEIMDERFRRLVLPTIVSRNWLCLNSIELRGVRSSNGQGKLAMELRAVLGENTTIVVKEVPESVHNYSVPYHWH